MLLSPRPSHVVRHWRTLLTSLALITAGAHAQEQTARLVKDANAAKQGLPAGVSWIEPVAGGVVFPMDKLASGKELWFSDGTAKGTRLLKDIAPGSGGSSPQQGLAFGTGAGARVAFLTQDPSYTADSSSPPELDLWVTDGTAAGTLRVLESSFPEEIGNTSLRAAIPNGVFLEDSSWLEDGTELIFSDGTPQGTHSLNPFDGEDRVKFSDPKSYFTSGSWCYFTANGNEMWRSDGTDAGTTKLTTFTGITPRGGCVIGDTLYIRVDVVAGISTQVWKCPVTGGTASLVTPPGGVLWTSISSMESVGNKLVIVIQDLVGKNALWVYDVASAGATRIPLKLPGQTVESQIGFSLTEWQGAIYFSTLHPGVGSATWRTDGTAAGTTILKSVKPPYTVSDGMLPGTDGIYFLQTTDKGYQLWRTQGTTATTLALKGTPYLGSGSQLPVIITPTDSTVFFLSGQETPDEFLVCLKNSKGGKLQLTSPESINGTGIPPHPLGAPPYQIRNGSMLEFVHTGRGQELWQIDLAKGKSRSLFNLSLALRPGGQLGFRGTTPAGELFTRFGGDRLTQVFVTDATKRNTYIIAEDPAAYTYEFAKVGEQWFISPTYPLATTSSTISKTDGTIAGTSVIEAAGGTKPNRVGNIVPFQGALYFIAVVNTKRELWRTDGTPAGTVRVANTWYGDANETITNLSTADGKLFFSVLHSGKEYIWRSDGTADGTYQVTGITTFTSLVTPIIDLAGLPVFQARQTTTGDVQWWSIGSGQITRIESMPVDSSTKLQSSFPKYAVAGSQLFFSADSGGDTELWVTNGTTAGTHRVKDINPGLPSSRPSSMVTVGNHIYFVATDADHGRELWRSDGTDAGTVLVADVEPGQNSSQPFGLKMMTGKLYFSADRRTTGRELYSIELPAQP